MANKKGFLCLVRMPNGLLHGYQFGESVTYPPIGECWNLGDYEHEGPRAVMKSLKDARKLLEHRRETDYLYGYDYAIYGVLYQETGSEVSVDAEQDEIEAVLSLATSVLIVGVVKKKKKAEQDDMMAQYRQILEDGYEERKKNMGHLRD